MPLFGIGNRFSPKRATPRSSKNKLSGEKKLDDLYTDNHKITLNLGDSACIFENGKWVQGNVSANNLSRCNYKLRSRITELEEENNILNLKVELLLNMLTETTAESHLQQREIEKLKKP